MPIGGKVEIKKLEMDLDQGLDDAHLLRQIEASYKNLIENLGVGLAIISPDMKILAVNDQIKKVFPELNLVNKYTCYEFFQNAFSVCAGCPTQLTLQDGQVHENSIQTRVRDNIIHCRIIASPVFDKYGKIIAATEIVENITDKVHTEAQVRQLTETLEHRVAERTNQLGLAYQNLELKINELELAQKALERSNYQNSLLLAAVGEGIFGANNQGEINFINPAALNLIGYSAEELICRKIHRVIHHTRVNGESYPEEECPMHLTLKDGLPRNNNEDIFWRRDGSSFHVEYTCTPVREKGSVIGVVVVFRDVTERWVNEEYARQSFLSLKKTLEETVNAFMLVAEKRDPYTAGHQLRVAELACFIAAEMGLNARQMEGVRIAGNLHDIGKIYVPADILNKPGRLTEMEMGIIKTHPQVSYDIIKDIPFEFPVAATIYQHHERLDGSGYPQGLTGDAILLEAKILAVADVLEAMASHRPYRPARDLQVALNEIIRNKGILYDQAVVEACLKVYHRVIPG